MKTETLIEKAKLVREKAYAPYSKFKVGAALEVKSGTVYTGCNIENSSYSLTCCAERVAIFQAIAQGEREFNHLVVIGDTEEPIRPCGACRQVMSEFFDENVKITLINLQGDYEETNISQLLPASFTLKNEKNKPSQVN
jgi:cytidine deaminase